MLSFLKNAHVYENLSDIAKIQIHQSYPSSITNNILLIGLADKLVDVVVTPSLVELAAKPAVMASVEFARSPAEIIDQKIVVPTATYKSQVNATITDFGLPRILTTQLTGLVTSLPAQITLIDLEKHPNNVLSVIIKAHELFKQNEVALTVTWTVLIISGLLMLFINLHNLRKITKLVLVSFGLAAVVIFAGFFIIPWLLELTLQSSGTSLLVAQNNLIMDAISYFMIQVRVYAIVYLCIGILFVVVYKFVHFETLQAGFNKILKKLHIPNISVKPE